MDIATSTTRHRKSRCSLISCDVFQTCTSPVSGLKDGMTSRFLLWPSFFSPKTSCNAARSGVGSYFARNHQRAVLKRGCPGKPSGRSLCRKPRPQKRTSPIPAPEHCGRIRLSAGGDCSQRATTVTLMSSPCLVCRPRSSALFQTCPPLYRPSPSTVLRLDPVGLG